MSSKIVSGHHLSSSNSVLLVCDMQEKFRPAIQYFDSITKGCSRLIEGTKLLNIPLIVSEQYPKGLGHTVSDLDVQHAVKVFEKTLFTMVTKEMDSLLKTISSGGPPTSIILCGIETHVCVQQTALDLLARGFEVHLVADASSSRNQADRCIAFNRLSAAGVVVTTTESVLFQLMGSTSCPQFKAIQALIREVLPDSGLCGMGKL